MDCYKCGKDMDSTGTKASVYGMRIFFEAGEGASSELIALYNKQLGKYSDGKGRSPDIHICCECFIDAILK